MRRALVALTILAVSFSTQAHEFWLQAEPYSPAAGTSVRLTLWVGENFVGDQVAFAAGHAAALRRINAAATEDLLARAALKKPRGELRIDAAKPGTHLLVFDSQPTLITLSADKFHAYLHDEGLDEIVRQREAAGNATRPGRERYRRCVKALLRVGGQSDTTHSARTGQRLEIVPQNDPLATRAGAQFDFAITFDNRPVAGRLVKAWNKGNNQTMIIRANTDRSGHVSFNLPYAGTWMISLVHMIPTTDTADADWDSFWGNLTFEVAA